MAPCVFEVTVELKRVVSKFTPREGIRNSLKILLFTGSVALLKKL